MSQNINTHFKVGEQVIATIIESSGDNPEQIGKRFIGFLQSEIKIGAPIHIKTVDRGYAASAKVIDIEQGDGHLIITCKSEKYTIAKSFINNKS